MSYEMLLWDVKQLILQNKLDRLNTSNYYLEVVQLLLLPNI